mmetsp:Transcript_12409/g.38305  ORF Transcript_12409/g.38305 Transcript_12409/m.38305 type:complete len:240 (+) Transcript_12409:729-1448(+)
MRCLRALAAALPRNKAVTSAGTRASRRAAWAQAPTKSRSCPRRPRWPTPHLRSWPAACPRPPRTCSACAPCCMSCWSASRCLRAVATSCPTSAKSSGLALAQGQRSRAYRQPSGVIFAWRWRPTRPFGPPVRRWGACPSSPGTPACASCASCRACWSATQSTRLSSCRCFWAPGAAYRRACWNCMCCRHCWQSSGMRRRALRRSRSFCRLPSRRTRKRSCGARFWACSQSARARTVRRS